jgi:NAD(P)-dependent dehydrogenase (short-subunit alcohol dehydrogenase family)
VVTGTSRGVGVGIAHQLLLAGVTVVGCSRNPLVELPGTADIPGGSDRSAQWVCDKGDYRAIDEFVGRVTHSTRRRAFQVATGNVGSEIVTRLRDHPDLELVELRCYSAGKVGRAAGKNDGFSEPARRSPCASDHM